MKHFYNSAATAVAPLAYRHPEATCGRMSPQCICLICEGVKFFLDDDDDDDVTVTSCHIDVTNIFIENFDVTKIFIGHFMYDDVISPMTSYYMMPVFF